MPVVDRLTRRFSIGRICIVADRGMISADTLAELEARKLLYILGVRERSDRLVRELVLDNAAPFVPLTLTRRNQEIDYGAKAVSLAGRRYIVCRNEEEANKDAAERQAILDSLARQLSRGDKALVGNTGYRRFLKTTGRGHFAIDQAKAEDDARFDGIFVLQTNAGLDPLQTMLRYKQLWAVEAAFRTTKHLFATRPIYHKLDETIRGHVFCSFLALVLKSALDDRIAGLGQTGSWPAILADLDLLTETDVEQAGARPPLRSQARRQPRAACHRRRPPAHRPNHPQHLTNAPTRSATPPSRRRFPCLFNYLIKPTVEDGPDVFSEIDETVTAMAIIIITPMIRVETLNPIGFVNTSRTTTVARMGKMKRSINTR